jgi:hypothetical protein
MKTALSTMKWLGIFFAGSFLIACGESTSKSNRNSSSNPDKPIISKPEPLRNLTPIDITLENYTEIASQSLKSLLLNDAGFNAINQTMNITGTQRGELAGVATGVVIQLHSYPCVSGGNVGFNADISNANGGLQIDLNSAIHVEFTTAFVNCNQNGSLLDGEVNLTMTGNLNEWLNGTHYTFDSSLSTDSLFVEQQNMPSFLLKGQFDLSVRSNDGITFITEVTSNNSSYMADTSYQILDFQLQKTYNSLTNQYSYLIESEFNDLYNQEESVQYQTLEPITGSGLELPSDGVIAITGIDSSVMVYVEADQTLRLELDLNNDNQIDDVYYSDWNELVLKAFDNVQF